MQKRQKKLHMRDSEGLPLCKARRGFKSPVAITDVIAKITCQTCAGMMWGEIAKRLSV